MKVQNINGTSDSKCSCGSWLHHWKNFSGQSFPTFCPETKCINKDLVGAHVQKASSSDNKWYILPLCSEHNKATGTLEVSDTYKLVAANKKETCDK
jgi:hypothetical protein